MKATRLHIYQIDGYGRVMFDDRPEGWRVVWTPLAAATGTPIAWWNGATPNPRVALFYCKMACAIEDGLDPYHYYDKGLVPPPRKGLEPVEGGGRMSKQEKPESQEEVGLRLINDVVVTDFEALRKAAEELDKAAARSNRQNQTNFRSSPSPRRGYSMLLLARKEHRPRVAFKLARSRRGIWVKRDPYMCVQKFLRATPQISP